VLLLDILANVASDTLAGEGLFAALRRQFVVEDGRTTSLDVRNALERRRRQAAALPSRSLKNQVRGRAVFLDRAEQSGGEEADGGQEGHGDQYINGGHAGDGSHEESSGEEGERH
jgi:hypothetical protein